jgi:RES domain-containing protein
MTPKSYVRVTPMAHAATPLGAGFKVTRFASPTKTFKVIYLAQDLTTAIAETLVRDRFQGCKTACKRFQIPHALCLNAFYRYAVITAWKLRRSSPASRHKRPAWPRPLPPRRSTPVTRSGPSSGRKLQPIFRTR